MGFKRFLSGCFPCLPLSSPVVDRGATPDLQRRSAFYNTAECPPAPMKRPPPGGGSSLYRVRFYDRAASPDMVARRLRYDSVAAGSDRG